MQHIYPLYFLVDCLRFSFQHTDGFQFVWIAPDDVFSLMIRKVDEFFVFEISLLMGMGVYDVERSVNGG